MLAILFPSIVFGENKRDQDQQGQDRGKDLQCPVVYDDTSYADEDVIPRIDDEAASIVRDKDGKIVEEKGAGMMAGKNKSGYSQNFWMLLFGAYLFLLIFNLSFDFKKKNKIQWFWEALFTFLAIYVWDNLDIGRDNSWFPGVILESGVIIYAFYFYFLDKKSMAKD